MERGFLVKSAKREVREPLPLTSTGGNASAFLVWLPMYWLLQERVFVNVQDPVWSEVFS